MHESAKRQSLPGIAIRLGHPMRRKMKQALIARLVKPEQTGY